MATCLELGACFISKRCKMAIVGAWL